MIIWKSSWAGRKFSFAQQKNGALQSEQLLTSYVIWVNYLKMQFAHL